MSSLLLLPPTPPFPSLQSPSQIYSLFFFNCCCYIYIDTQIYKYNLVSQFLFFVYGLGTDHFMLDNQVGTHPGERLILPLSIITSHL